MKESRVAQDIQAQAESLAHVLNHQSGEGLANILHAASLIQSGKTVLITGIGASMFASIPLEYALCARGINAQVIEAGELLHYRYEAYKDAIVVIVSRSGESIEIKRLLELFGKRHLIIGVTNEAGSLLGRTADVVLYIGSLSDEIVAIQTYTGTLLALYILERLLDDSITTVYSEVKEVVDKIATVVSASLEDMERWDKFLEIDSPVYCLARGPSYASAMESALLFNELAKSPAHGMASATFRHGPVEVVDQKFRGLIFAPEGKTRDLNISLAEDIAHFGGGVRIIGPFSRSEETLEGHWIPAVSEPLAPLFEIIPVQVAALRLAMLRGIRPGSFRYAPQVTVDEARFPSP